VYERYNDGVYERYNSAPLLSVRTEWMTDTSLWYKRVVCPFLSAI
jgi:hypothetical protein